MKVCKNCGEKFYKEDFENYGQPISEEDYENCEYCPQCSDGIDQFQDDYNDLHPNETVDEFEDH
ncbi:MAG: hypothetical protein PF549_05145 [Patescibacteria group bacterium]|jgi:hypothetical protein|nr:hypothetical protein [Patescibacteria group bacterium]